MFDAENITISANQFNILATSFVDNFTSFTRLGDDFREVESKLNISYAVTEILIAFVAVVGNALVIVVFFRERRLRKRTNFYIISLAFADFLLGLFGIPFAVLISVGFPTQHYTICLSMITSLKSFCTISIFNLVLISFDRFISIVFPMKYSEAKTAMMIEIAGCWVLGIVIGFLPFAWHQNAPITQCYYHDVVTEGYQMFRILFVVVFPACIIFGIYGFIYRIVLQKWKHETTLRKSSMNEIDGCINSTTRHEIKITLNIFMIVVFFMICWLPLNVIKFMRIVCRSCTIRDDLIMLGIILTHFNSAVNPLMYAYHLKDFRHSILVLIGRRRREPSISF